MQEYVYDDWLSEQREHLQAMYLSTGDRLARMLSERNEWQEVVTVCQNLLTHDNCWEEAYRLLMLAYERLGSHAQALRVYRRCEQTLQSELGVQPSESIQKLWLVLSSNGVETDL